MNSLRPELHIAQQSRRDKLRIQQDTYFPHDALSYDASEMINFSVNPGPLKRPEEAPFPTTDAQYFSTWKTSQDWVANHTSIYNSTNPISALNVKPDYLGYDQELHPSLPNSDSSLYQNIALQDLEFASLRHKSSGETGLGGPWLVGGNGSSQWCGELDFTRSNAQALSLSLSSVPRPKVHETQIAERGLQARGVCGSSNDQDSRTWKPEMLLPPIHQNVSSSSRIHGAQGLTHRNPGPLGPFTGYATILRSSRFLRPAQQMLEELCCIAGPKDVEICDVSDEILEEVRVSSEGDTNDNDCAMGAFVFNGSSGKSQEAGGTSCSLDAQRPENHQRKAKLLFMKDEVCKRYKQYHQQMQMVVSSFESVAGLSAATPYVSLALKMIAKHFRCLMNAIMDQLKSIKNALRDEFSSPSAATAGNKGDANASGLKFFDQSFQKQKGAGNIGILENQHIWRPQRGLPERAVSVLRAWLFDHFLHPYPTDTDKHMLATQTGLTRNQVSNWFINARVRIWKPMVEEIHMLETKVSENVGKSSNGKTAVEGCSQGDDSSQSLNRLRLHAVPDQQGECSGFGPPGQEGDKFKASMWNQEKRSRIEYHVQGSVDGPMMGFMPSHGSGIEGGGIGSVSLTLGLRQSPEGGQLPPMQQERHMRHYGGQIIRDFVG
ncbi:BEL1-like homeodomain protein 8 [Salvia hispanica]|uniref:BEL1-like homeodomain protein 8 n=1 Tax=Salvia hispanica TaxID=49212 RepID=UPI0020096A8C|nr:BEL1-like homeodomain protein 8 [Salvia hispanica]XP_047939805.1 BEL1-like homeodomain protein 8 [Salvia hispanica]